METFSNILTLLLVFILIFILYWYYNTGIQKNLPPGPRGLPIVGSLLSLGKKPYLTFIDLAKKYGNIFHLYMGSTLAIVLNDFEAIKEAFTKQAEIFSGRIDDPHFRGHEDGNLGLILNDGEYWRQHRRFLISNLRTNGVGKNVLEPRIMNEILCFMNELKKVSGQQVHIKRLINYSVLNNVMLLANNTRYDYDDPKMTNYVKNINNYVELSKSVALDTFFPWIGKIPGLEVITKVKERNQVNKAVLNSVKEFIVMNDSEDTYIKAYMTERNNRMQHTDNETIFTEKGLVHNSRDLLGAGGETTATLLSWIMLYLSKFPKVQVKAQEEIDKTIGRDREVTYDDRLLTPYVEAIIMETQRIVTLVPLSIPHRCIRNTTLFGYSIPVNTMIFPNVYAVHHDTKLWGDPENFRPERFIDDDGQLLKPEYLIPFSMGKRACAGEPLARLELYLYLASFLQIFKLIPPKSRQNLEANDSIVRYPISDIVCFEQR